MHNYDVGCTYVIMYVRMYVCRNALKHAFHVLAIDLEKSQQKVSICVCMCVCVFVMSVLRFKAETFAVNVNQ